MFTDLYLRRLKHGGGQYRVYDTVQKGLSLLVSSGGTKSFASTFTLHDKAITRKIGRLGENSSDTGENFSVRAARERCRLDRALAAEGKDPRAIEVERAKAREADAFTVEKAIRKFIDERCKARGLRTWDQTESVLTQHSRDEGWLNRPVSTITRSDFRELLQRLQQTGKVSTTRQAYGWIKTLWRWMAEVEILEHDTLHPVRLDLARKVRDWVFCDAELKAIWNAAERLTDEECAFVHLIMLLVPRKSALALSHWSHFDKDAKVWTTPFDLTKSKGNSTPRTYKTPLPKMAREILQSLPRKADRVFPSLPTHITGTNRKAFFSRDLITALKKNGAPKDFFWHALRHTCATWLENEGYDLFDRGLVLNHSMGGVTSGYSHGAALDRKLGVYEAWSKHLSEVT